MALHLTSVPLLEHECPDCGHYHYQPTTSTYDECWCGCELGGTR